MTYEMVKELIGRDFSENEVIGYDVSNGERFAIVANNVDDVDMWFGCEEYGYVYTFEELSDKELVELC